MTWAKGILGGLAICAVGSVHAATIDSVTFETTTAATNAAQDLTTGVGNGTIQPFGDTDWMAWNRVNNTTLEVWEKKDATNISSVLTLGSAADYKSTDGNLKIAWDTSDEQNGTAAPGGNFGFNLNPSNSITGTVTGIGTSGTFYLLGTGWDAKDNNDITVSITITDTVGGNDTDSSAAWDVKTDTRQQTTDWEIDYSGVQDPNATLTWTISATKDLKFGAVALDAVPEPGSIALLGLGTLLIARRRR